LAGSLGDQLLSIRVDKSSPVPVYVQIAAEVRRLVRGGTVAPDSELPSERLLCEAYGVSRMTLRQALGVLEREGLIEARRGRGTFVSLPAAGVAPLPGIPEEMIAGPAAFTRLLQFRMARPTAPAREFFGPAHGERVYQIRRLRFAHGNPVALEFVQLPQALCPNLNQLDLVHDSFYRILEERYRLRLAECIEEISALRPSPGQRRLLQAPSSAAILMVCRRTRTTTGAPALFAITAYRGDRYTAVRSVSCNLPIHGSAEGLFHKGNQTSPAVRPAGDGS
jgi:GntR family transcriptional regulator